MNIQSGDIEGQGKEDTTCTQCCKMFVTMPLGWIRLKVLPIPLSIFPYYDMEFGFSPVYSLLIVEMLSWTLRCTIP